MGDYTALIGKLELKGDVAKEVIVKDRGGCVDVDWHKLKRVRRLRKHPDVLAFLSTPRCGMIVGGASSYHDLDVDDYDCPDPALLEGLSGESDCDYHVGTRTLRFFCSLKDYANTIHMFSKIVDLLADEYTLCKKFEDDSPLELIETTHPGVRVQWIINAYLRERSDPYGFI